MDSADLQTVLASITVDTCLVTVMLANNQTEILQPVPTTDPVSTDPSQQPGPLKILTLGLTNMSQSLLPHLDCSVEVSCINHWSNL